MANSRKHETFTWFIHFYKEVQNYLIDSLLQEWEVLQTWRKITEEKVITI